MRTSRTPRPRVAVVIALAAASAGCGGNDGTVHDAGPDGAPVFQFLDITAGEHSTCDVVERSSPFGRSRTCWGHNEAGVFGTGDQHDSSEPGEVLADFAQWPWYSGLVHQCALAPGTDYLHCWGSNESGQLGIGSRDSPQLVPQPVRGDIPFHLVAPGYDHTCAIAIDNHAYCWGSNAFGQLGHDSDSVEELEPVPVAGNYFFSAITAGDRFTCAIARPDDAVYCWGLDSDGQLGDGGAITGMNTSVSRRPVKVDSDSAFFSVHAGGASACGLEMTETVVCWGKNDVGQLGNGGTESQSSPVPISLEAPLSQVAVGGRHACALERSHPRAWCWGANEHGQLGAADPVDFSAQPLPVAGDMIFGEIALAKGEGAHSCATSNNFDRAYCWGRNDFGQLGNGAASEDRVDSPQPVTGQP